MNLHFDKIRRAFLRSKIALAALLLFALDARGGIQGGGQQGGGQQP